MPRPSIWFKASLFKLSICAALFLGACQRVHALTPAQVAVIINGNNPNSWMIAKYYAKERHIPLFNLIALDLPHNNTQIPVEIYDVRISSAIRQILRERHLNKSIRCLVTTWGIPLRVAGSAPLHEATVELTQIRQGILNESRLLEQGVTELNNLSVSGSTSVNLTNPIVSAPVGNIDNPTKIGTLALQRFQQALNIAIHRISLKSEHRRESYLTRLLPILDTYVGPMGVTAMVHVYGSSTAAQKEHNELSSMKQQIKKYIPGLVYLNQRRDIAENRIKLRLLRFKLYGVVGLTEQLLSDMVYLQQQPSSTAVDNDLMTLWYQSDAGLGMESNPVYLPNWNRTLAKTEIKMPLIVSRLDGTSPQMVMHMIRTSVKIQKTGLRGIAYFDARGLHGQDAYSQFDQVLRQTALFIRKNTAMPVVLEDTPAFLQAKNSPREAIYCGWYSLEHYLDSCQWLPGSVAFHVASFELLSLHNPHYTGWCPNLLKHGVCGTLGAVAEPYLTAFPPPSLFFPLLLSGRFTQGEVYEATCPLVDWRIAYVGDPLYNPFKHNPIMPMKVLLKNPLFRRAFEEFHRPMSD